MSSDYLSPTARCEVPTILCGWEVTCKTYNDAVLAAVKHNKETGHVVRAEQIRTTLIGWNINKDLEGKPI